MLQESSNIGDEELQEYKNFAAEFDKVILYNTFKEANLKKEDLIKVLIDLGFVHAQKLSLSYHIEFAMKLPMVNLLWTILTKNQDK